MNKENVSPGRSEAEIIARLHQILKASTFLRRIRKGPYRAQSDAPCRSGLTKRNCLDTNATMRPTHDCGAS
jgi:hypothetical protein